MFKVLKDARGRYQITIGVGKTFPARDLQEVGYALEHYFLDGLFHEGTTPPKYDYSKHIAHNQECHCCPLCR